MVDVRRKCCQRARFQVLWVQECPGKKKLINPGTARKVTPHAGFLSSAFWIPWSQGMKTPSGTVTFSPSLQLGWTHRREEELTWQDGPCLENIRRLTRGPVAWTRLLVRVPPPPPLNTSAPKSFESSELVGLKSSSMRIVGCPGNEILSGNPNTDFTFLM